MDKKQRYGLRKTTMGLVSGIIMGLVIIPVFGAGITVSAETDSTVETADEAEIMPISIVEAMPFTKWRPNTVLEIENEIKTQLANQPEDTHEYVIQWGDTVWGITQAFDLDLDAFVQANGIENPDLIYTNDIVSLDVDNVVVTDRTVNESVSESTQETETVADESVVDSSVSEKDVVNDAPDEKVTPVDAPETKPAELDESKAPGGLTTPKPSETIEDIDTDGGNFSPVDGDNTDTNKDESPDEDATPTTPVENDNDDVADENDTPPVDNDNDVEDEDVDDNEDIDEGLEPNTPVDEGETVDNVEIIKGEVPALPDNVAPTKGDLIETVEVARWQNVAEDPDDNETFIVQYADRYNLNHGIEYHADPEMPAGETRVVAEGVNGIIETLYSVVEFQGNITGPYRDNQEANFVFEADGDRVTEESLSSIVMFGTQTVDTKRETVTVNVPFETEYQDNDKLEKGKTRVVVRGVNGVKTEVYETSVVGDEAVGERQLVSETVDTAVVNQVIERGTMVVENKTETEEVRTEPKVVWVDNADLNLGEERVQQTGQDKVVKITYAVRYENGVEASRTETGRETVNAGRDTIMERGTKVDRFAFDTVKLNTEMLALINAERADVGVGSLSYDSSLQQGTNVRADEIYDEDSLTVDGVGHVRPDGSDFNTAFEYLPNNGHLLLGENLAQNWIDIEGLENVEAGETTIEKVLAKQFFDQYYMSPGHYQNMINDGYVGFSTGVRIADNGKIFNVQIFTLDSAIFE